MSITDGQLVNAEVTNAAFLSRTTDTDTVGAISLKKAGQEEILDIQAQINRNRTKVYVISEDISNQLELTLGIGEHVVISSSSGGAINLAAQPFIFDGSTTPSNNYFITLIGTSDTDYLTLVYSDTAGGCLINGNFQLKRGHSIQLFYSIHLERAVEVSRNV